MNGSGMEIVLVAAIGANNVIGRGGGLPWHIRSDLQLFKRLTLNKPVVMGRNTYESIGKSLPNRTNIVVTRDLTLRAPGAQIATSVDAALGAARNDARQRGVNEIMVIGGSDIFDATIKMATRLEITHVHASPEGGDRFFPPIDPEVWREKSRQEYPRGPHDDHAFTTAVYVRR
jgi:dihydrofolate reductase